VNLNPETPEGDPFRAPDGHTGEPGLPEKTARIAGGFCVFLLLLLFLRVL
jgi:hypothetical protein